MTFPIMPSHGERRRTLIKAGFFLSTASGAMLMASAAAAQAPSPPAPASKPAPAAPEAAAPGTDAPIVPDSQFQKELPPLDPDLSKPLEPLSTFQGPAPTPAKPCQAAAAAAPQP